ncbi:MAG: hypothetical protein GKR90_19265 [Pseudomonadales bacterium]|nr:hypothetical protein [Pseudomonadales bacterium]
MNDRDPNLMALFRQDLDEIPQSTTDNEEFIQQVATEVMRLHQRTNQRRLLTMIVGYVALMTIVGLGLFILASAPITDNLPNAVNNLATPIGILFLVGWILQRKIFS